MGGSQDYWQAMEWYRQAGEQGDGVSQSSLGTLYAEGRGVPRDPVRAYFWLSLAEASLPASEKG